MPPFLKVVREVHTDQPSNDLTPAGDVDLGTVGREGLGCHETYTRASTRDHAHLALHAEELVGVKFVCLGHLVVVCDDSGESKHGCARISRGNGFVEGKKIVMYYRMWQETAMMLL